MKKHTLSINTLLFLTLGLIGLSIAACSSVQPDILPSSTPGMEQTALPTATLTPSLTPTPLAPLVILLAGQDSDPALTSSIQATLTGLSEQAGLRFQLREQLTTSDLQAEEVKLVVVVPPDPGLSKLAKAAPDTQFLTIGIPGLEPDTNLSTIGSQGNRPDQLAFTAGYLAAAITEDWRVGVVTGGDDPSGKAAELGFANGVHFHCGLCRSLYPPFPLSGYPLVVQLPVSSNQSDRQSALDYFQVWQVGTVYVAPEAADQELLKELADAGMNIIGTNPPPPNIQSNWVATLSYDDPTGSLLEIWPALLDGNGGQSIDLPLTLTDVNPDLLSAGRQRLVEEMLSDMLAGYIDTGVDPVTGESSVPD